MRRRLAIASVVRLRRRRVRRSASSSSSAAPSPTRSCSRSRWPSASWRSSPGSMFGGVRDRAAALRSPASFMRRPTRGGRRRWAVGARAGADCASDRRADQRAMRLRRRPGRRQTRVPAYRTRDRIRVTVGTGMLHGGEILSVVRLARGCAAGDRRRRTRRARRRMRSFRRMRRRGAEDRGSARSSSSLFGALIGAIIGGIITGRRELRRSPGHRRARSSSSWRSSVRAARRAREVRGDQEDHATLTDAKPEAVLNPVSTAQPSAGVVLNGEPVGAVAPTCRAAAPERARPVRVRRVLAIVTHRRRRRARPHPGVHDDRLDRRATSSPGARSTGATCARACTSRRRSTRSRRSIGGDRGDEHQLLRRLHRRDGADLAGRAHGRPLHVAVRAAPTATGTGLQPARRSRATSSSTPATIDFSIVARA